MCPAGSFKGSLKLTAKGGVIVVQNDGDKDIIGIALAIVIEQLVDVSKYPVLYLVDAP